MTPEPVRQEERKQLIKEHVTEWDEYGQGYGDKGLIVCICGEMRPDAKWGDHFCPYDADPEEESDANSRPSKEERLRDGVIQAAAELRTAAELEMPATGPNATQLLLEKVAGELAALAADTEPEGDR